MCVCRPRRALDLVYALGAAGVFWVCFERNAPPPAHTHTHTHATTTQQRSVIVDLVAGGLFVADALVHLHSPYTATADYATTHVTTGAGVFYLYRTKGTFWVDLCAALPFFAQLVLVCWPGWRAWSADPASSPAWGAEIISLLRLVRLVRVFAVIAALARGERASP